jgi:acyl dehydratase
MTVILSGIAGLQAHAGQHLGFGPWVEVTQQRINQFAEATGDHQWIHVDVDRARGGPFGKTIAHGLLTLSMIGALSQEVFRFEGFKMGVNYGYDKIRFPQPVPVDSRLRLGAKVMSVETIASGVQTLMELTIEVEGAGKPACVAQMIFRHSV